MQRYKHLYIHIPFCRRRCSYCDFNTYANLEDRITQYVQALCVELAMLRDEFTSPALARHTLSSEVRGPGGENYCASLLRPTIFFGGGTPSILTLAHLEQILDAASTLVPLEQAEITLEANPGTFLGVGTDALTYLRGLRSLGINRLSLGVQTLHDPTLRVLGRTHTAAEAYRCFAVAREAGFDNISLDFMFGLPGQTLSQWEETLDRIITWEADHFSLYSLILEERTPLYAQVVGGRVTIPDDDATAAMYEHAIECLSAAGYQQYEISNWARVTHGDAGPRGQSIHTDPSFPLPPGFGIPRYSCHHNLAYWLNSDYLAAGAGAHGHVYPRRYANILGVDAYIHTVETGQLPVSEHIALTQADLYAETMFMGLRLNEGVSLTHFRERCGSEMASVYSTTLQALERQGLIVCDAVGVRLTPHGRMLGNQVFMHFVT